MDDAKNFQGNVPMMEPWRKAYDAMLNLMKPKLKEILREVPKIPGTPCFFFKDLCETYQKVLNKKIDRSLFLGKHRDIKNHPLKLIYNPNQLKSILYDKNEDLNERDIIKIANSLNQDDKQDEKQASNSSLQEENLLFSSSKSNLSLQNDKQASNLSLQNDKQASNSSLQQENKPVKDSKYVLANSSEEDSDSLELCILPKNKPTPTQYYSPAIADASDDDSLEIIECASKPSTSPGLSKNNSSDDIKILSKSQNPYEEDSDDEMAVTSRFISPLLPPQNNPPAVTYSSLCESILESFRSAPVCPIDAMQISYCEVHGKMFDYKTAPCPLPNHPHPTLSKYLKCHKELDLRQLSKLYLIRKDPVIKKIVQRRFKEYKRKRDDPLFALSVEACCVNLFSTRVTLSFYDFVELFKIIYGSMPYPEPVQEFLCNLRSPNIVIVKKNGTYTVTLCPTRHSRYVEWESKEKHRAINEIENQIESHLLGDSVVAKKDKFSGPNKLASIVELNVPRRLQIKNPESEPMTVENCYLFSMIKFDEKRPYFTGLS